MRACVVYESMYGNTRRVAEAVAEGLREGVSVEVGSVTEIAPDRAAEADLLVVGGPTHVHGMSRSASRAAAAEAAEKDDQLEMEPDATEIGVRDWLNDLPDRDGRGIGVAYDTRIDKPVILVGSAAKGIGKRLSRRGFADVDPPQSFFVDDEDSHLLEGEEDRAREWGRQLAERCRQASAA